MREGDNDFWSSVLKGQGFEKIGEVQYIQRVQLWWHAVDKLEVLVYDVGTGVVVKGTKTYYMKAIAPEGEVYARDLNNLQGYLEAHLPEIHITFSYFRDITVDMASRRIREKRSTRAIEEPHENLSDQEDELRRLRNEFDANRRTLHEADKLLKLDTGGASLVESYLKKRSNEIRRHLEEVRRRGKRLEGVMAGTKQLLNEYRKKGSAACFMISFSSNLQIATGTDEFQVVLDQIVKEVMDLHRYQVQQKLNGGKLKVFVEEASDPVLSWQTAWGGGVLNPVQLSRLGPEYENLSKRMDTFLMITPTQDIRAGGVVDEKKLLGAWFVRNFLKRLDRVPEPDGVNGAEIPRGGMPIWVGSLIKQDIVTSEPAVFPLAGLESIYVSGSSGSGKSFLLRVVIEGAAAYEEIDILIFDPRNQWVGLLLPEDREDILAHYTAFGLEPKRARGFRFRYYAPGIRAGETLPVNLAELGVGRSIVSFKEMDDRERCERFADILEQVFESRTREESGTLRTVVAIIEAHLFTKKRVADDAKNAAERAERAIETALREGRKYGLRVYLESQTIKDFAYGSASIRQNTNTKVFLRNSDREVDYASDFIGDGREIIRLKTGTAICYNAQWGARKFKVRPPLSKVWEPSAQDTRRLVNGPSREFTPSLCPDARRLLDIARGHHDETGAPINLSQATEKLGITSKRRMQELIEELERKGLVRTAKLRERGSPRVIIPTVSPFGPDAD